jgi:hypothetical protein
VDAGTWDDWVRDTGFEFLKALYAEYGDYLGRDRSVARLEEMAHRICVHTAKPVLDLPATNEFLAQFSGPNTRWESLGIMCLYWDLWSRPHDPAVIDGPPPDNLLARTLATVVSCVDLCQEFSDGNVFQIFLSHKRTIFESLISGDASQSTTIPLGTLSESA